MPKQTINATKFKAKCLDLLDQVQRGELEELEVTKRGKVVARVVPPAVAGGSLSEWIKSMKGRVHIPPGFDLTEPVFDGVCDAELGILHN